MSPPPSRRPPLGLLSAVWSDCDTAGNWTFWTKAEVVRCDDPFGSTDGELSSLTVPRCSASATTNAEFGRFLSDDSEDFSALSETEGNDETTGNETFFVTVDFWDSGLQFVIKLMSSGVSVN
jgi:hypothetical protein